MIYLVRITILFYIFKFLKAIILSQSLLKDKYGFSNESIVIDLSECKISSIEIDSFEGYNRLEFLYLHNNKLSKIEKNVFSKLVNLRELWLESNVIVLIDKYPFAGLNKLKLVCLNDNPVSTLFPIQTTSICDIPLQCLAIINKKCNRYETSNLIYKI
jgi:Leucine-rich repeat (LRR) protein